MDAKSTFVNRFGDLVALLRVDPGNDAAQDLALAVSTDAVEREAVEVVAGAEGSITPEGLTPEALTRAALTLEGRLFARRVGLIRIAAGAGPDELLALARALSHDRVPVQSSSHIQVELMRTPGPPPSPPAPAAAYPIARSSIERRAADERRCHARAEDTGIERRSGADRRRSGERRLGTIERATPAERQRAG